jgi:hypothetical protein
MDDAKHGSSSVFRKIMFKASKAMVKAVLFYAVYYVCWLFLAPIAWMIPGLQESIETFVTIYITVIIVGELLAGTVYQHFFGVVNALLVTFYLILFFKRATLSVAYQSVVLTVDLRILLMIAALLSLLGLGRSILQAISFASKRAEQTPM